MLNLHLMVRCKSSQNIQRLGSHKHDSLIGDELILTEIFSNNIPDKGRYSIYRHIRDGKNSEGLELGLVLILFPLSANMARFLSLSLSSGYSIEILSYSDLDELR